MTGVDFREASLTWQLFRHRMVPTLAGLAGYVLVGCAGLGAWYGWVVREPGSPGLPMAMPVAVFEIISRPAPAVGRAGRERRQSSSSS